MIHDLEGALPGTLRMRVCDSAAELAEAVAAAVREAVLTGLRARAAASLVVPGGSTPRAYLPRIAALDLPWPRVSITLSDERLVPPDDPHSNERLVRESLLRERAAAARFVPLHVEGEADPAAGAAARLASLPRPFDLVLLGIGNDSHVASLFPGADGVAPALETDGTADCVRLAPPRGIEPALPRVSLSVRALLDSRRILIAAQGVDKRAAFERAALGHWPQPSPLHALVQHAAQPIEFVWSR